MNGYQEREMLTVQRVARFMCRRTNVGRRITRHDLARAVSTEELPISAARITALIPKIEIAVADIGAERAQELWLARPTKFNDYGLAVTSIPFDAMLGAIQRQKNNVARASKDSLDGANLQRLTRCGDREVERQSQRFYDSLTLLVSQWDRQEEAVYALEEALLSSWHELPWIKG